MTLQAILIGSGIQHSKMPTLQHYLGTLAGIDINYGKVDGEQHNNFDPVEAVKQAIEDGLTGLNITHPYKQQIVSLVEKPWISGHQKIGSYNTLKFVDGTVLGANTDYSGFIRSYKKLCVAQPPGKILLSGAGGVGRAIAFALGDLGSTEIAIHDLVPYQADCLAVLLREHGINAKSVVNTSLNDAVKAADGLVNCTQVGMYRHPGAAIDLSLINAQQWAFDAVYTPVQTEFLKACNAAGLQCMTGFDLWLYQGIDAFKVFTGVEIEVTEELSKTARSWLDQ